MKKQFVPKILYILLLFIQVGLVTAVFVVNYLSGVKAGVYRHVYTRRMHYPFVFFYKKEKGLVLQSSNCFSDPS